MAAPSVHLPSQSSLVQLQQVFIPPFKSNKEKGRAFFSHCHRQPPEPPPRVASCTYNKTLPHIPHLYSGPYTTTTSISHPKIKDGATWPDDLVEKTKKTPDLICPTTKCGFAQLGDMKTPIPVKIHNKVDEEEELFPPLEVLTSGSIVSTTGMPCGEFISTLVNLDPPLPVFKLEMLRPREAVLAVTARVLPTTNGPAFFDDIVVTFGVGPLVWTSLKVGLEPTFWTDIFSVDMQQLSQPHVLSLMSLELGCLQCSCVDNEMGVNLPPPRRGLVSMPWKPPDYGHLACVISYYLFEWGTLSQLVFMSKICSPEILYPQVAQLQTRRVLVDSALPQLVYYWTGPQLNCYAWGLSPFVGGGVSVNGELDFVHDDGPVTNLFI